MKAYFGYKYELVVVFGYNNELVVVFGYKYPKSSTEGLGHL